MSALKFPLLLLVALGGALPVHGQGFFDQFIDPTDGMFDASGYFAKKGAFMPVPILITEPAVGAGGGLAAVWFHGKESREDPWREPPPGYKPLPPSVSVLTGAATSNGTWFLGGGHFGTWKKDTLRYKGFAGLASANLDYYVGSQPLGFNIESRFLIQELSARYKQSPVFLGARYSIAQSEVSFDIPGLPPGASAVSLDSDNAGLGPLIAYDDRDNIFTPSSGTQAQLMFMAYDEALGGDFGYNELEAKVTHFRPLDSDGEFTLGLRALASVVERAAPFYAKPSVTLRGVQAMRFQGDQVLSTESELRWAFTQRWSAIGFLGLGGARYESDALPDSGLVIAGGAGFRYKLARMLGVHGGLDLAWGPDGPVLYITVGSGL